MIFSYVRSRLSTQVFRSSILLLHIYLEIPHSQILSDFTPGHQLQALFNNTDNYMPLNVEHRQYQVVLYFQRNHKISQHTHECDSVYARKKYTGIPAQVSTKYAKAEQHCVKISNTEFHPN